MAARKDSPGYHCTECGWTTAKWVGRCGECQQWGSVVERGSTPSGPATKATSVQSPAVPITQVSADSAARFSTGVSEFDRVLGEGMVRGAVVLLAGEPGVGKSTLLLDVAARCAGAGQRVLYVTGEESAGQVSMRAQRIGALHDGLLVAAETDLGSVLGHVEQVRPDLVLVDSIQTIASAAVEGTPGGVTQVREVASALIKAAKSADNHPYPVGATLVKLEYDDENCRDLVGYTAMEKQPPGYSEAGNDWRWQRVDVDRNVLEDGELATCITCHQHHCTWPICGYERCGFDLTCGQELP